ncbi:MAG: hypothetical protein KGJ62_06765 [Armatimonadetes bacterium]|nr:hypothetical protein [Armatimonadota bacterium]MDE2207407.1 hypothetical protein [Armatimonadota bacterium]
MDVNVWLAISTPDSPHHERARRYWHFESGERVALCRVTALAILREWTNSRIMRHAVLTSAEAWVEHERWLALPVVIALGEQDGLDSSFGSYATTLTLGEVSWTDAYLAALCVASRRRMISFDVGLRRYTGLDLLHLKA